VQNRRGAPQPLNSQGASGGQLCWPPDRAIRSKSSAPSGASGLSASIPCAGRRSCARAARYIAKSAGAGIPKTLKNKAAGIDTDVKALTASIREGITNGRGQGNGLFGAFNVCSKSSGRFVIDSDTTVLTYNEKEGLHVRPNKIPVTGTTVWAVINRNVENLLEKALVFNNKAHYPVDYIENYYETKEKNKFSVFRESSSVGTRIAGLPLRNELKNLINMIDGVIYIDFDNINVASSSFLDEFLVKFIEEVTVEKFIERFKIINISETLLNLLGKSYYQRLHKTISEIFESTTPGY
jgi:hypothetical protein